jgi:hypothetical protein
MESKSIKNDEIEYEFAKKKIFGGRDYTVKGKIEFIENLIDYLSCNK